MSSEAAGWVYRHSPYRGADFQVHCAIADSANDQHGHELWMSQSSLADKARVSRGQANRSLRQLLDDGYVELLEERPGRPNRYRFVFPDDANVVYDTRRRRGAAAVEEPTEEPDGAPEGVTADDTPCDEPAHGCDERSQVGVTADHTTCNEGSHRTQENPSGEPEDEPKREPRAPARRGAGGARDTSADVVDLQDETRAATELVEVLAARVLAFHGEAPPTTRADIGAALALRARRGAEWVGKAVAWIYDEGAGGNWWRGRVLSLKDLHDHAETIEAQARQDLARRHDRPSGDDLRAAAAAAREAGL